MPELPEVETIRRGLQTAVSRKIIKDVQVLDKKAIQMETARFIKLLKNQTIVKVSRRGKLLIIKLAPSNLNLLIHLKMTGQLILTGENKLIAGGHNITREDLRVPNKYTRVIVKLSNGLTLYFNDLRRFGYCALAREKALKEILNKYGIEPLTPSFNWKNFKDIFIKHKNIPLKSLLMNQECIAGIGNIYADEICFASQIKPNKKVGLLPEVMIKKIFTNCQKIIRAAIKHRGTTFSNYLDHSGKRGDYTVKLKVYGRAKEKCLRCKTGIITKTKQGGRGTHYCPNCQK